MRMTGDDEEEVPEGHGNGISHSPRARAMGTVPEVPIINPDPADAQHILASCASLAVGLTQAVAGIRWNTGELTSVADGVCVERYGEDLRKSMEGFSVAGGVSYNTSRTGAVAREIKSTRQLMEWIFAATQPLEKNLQAIVDAINAMDLASGLENFSNEIKDPPIPLWVQFSNFRLPRRLLHTWPIRFPHASSKQRISPPLPT